MSGGALVEATGAEAGDRIRGRGAQLTGEGAEGAAELERPARLVAVPERHLPRLTGRRGDDHLLEGDVLDAPRRRAEEERLPRTALVDHLLVELAHPGAVGQRDREQPSVGDRARVGDREPLRAGASAHDALDPIPHEARPQLGELLGRVPTGQEVEHRGEHLVGQLGERRRAPHDPGEVLDGPLVERAHGHDLLAEHVDRVAGVVRGLDLPGLHPLDHDGGLEEVGPVLGEELAAARRTDLVARPADPLEPA